MNFPLPPNGHALAVLLLILFALFLFSRDKIPLETSSLLILILLATGFELFPFKRGEIIIHPSDFFHGFGHEALIAVCGLMVAGHGIVRTGALDPVGRVLAKFWKISPAISFLLTLLAGGIISAFINNVPVVVLLMPLLMSVSLRTGMAASSTLMPMGFATTLGGTCTTIGTSSNLLVVTVAADMGLERMQMFDFLYPASIAAGVGILYLWLIAPRITPERELTLSHASPRVFTAHLEILEGSPVEGKTLAEALKKIEGIKKILAVERGQGNFMLPLPTLILKAGDHLALRDTPNRLKEFEKVLQGTLYPEDSHSEPIDDDHPLKADDQQIAEVVIIEGSYFLGKTLNEIRFAERYGIMTLAIHRPGRQLEKLYDNIGEIQLRAGDILLVQGPRKEIASLKQIKDFLVLDATMDLPYTKKAPVASLIMLAVILTVATGILPIAISAPIGALLMIITGCLGWRDVKNALSSQVILIVVASLALGVALLKTGGAEYIAQLFVASAGNTSPVILISGLILLTAILTSIVTNNAAAVIGTPIAISIASQLGQPPEPFVLAVLFGVNMSFATPIAYKTNLLIMNAGNYLFRDFLRVGVPLVLLMWATLSLLLPAIYEIH